MTLLGKHATVTCAISCVAGAPSLEGSAGGVLGVLPERRGLDGHCRRASGTGHHVDQAGCAVHTADCRIRP
jgi:hypothetical protein